MTVWDEILLVALAADTQLQVEIKKLQIDPRLPWNEMSIERNSHRLARELAKEFGLPEIRED